MTTRTIEVPTIADITRLEAYAKRLLPGTRVSYAIVIRTREPRAKRKRTTKRAAKVRFVCGVCNYESKTAAGLGAHMRKHKAKPKPEFDALVTQQAEAGK